MIRADQNGQTFDMGVGIPEVGKFGDLILATKTPQPKKCRFIKVKNAPEKTIGLNDFLNDDGSDFDLSTYFFSRKDMMVGDFYLEDSENEFILYTNGILDLYSSIEKGSLDLRSWDRLKSIDYNQGVLQDLLDPIMKDDDLVDPYNRYRFNNIITPHLKSKINSRNVSRVAEMLIDWILEDKSLSEVKHALEPYYGYLTREVINVKKKKFHKKFFQDMKTESPNVFRFAFKNAMKTKNVNMKKLKVYLAELDDLQKIYSKEIVDFNEVIKEEEIEDYLSDFIVVSSQRNSESIQRLIINFVMERKNEEYMGCEFYTIDDIKRYIAENIKTFIRVMRLWVGMRATDLKCPAFFNERVFRKLISNHWHPNNRFEVEDPTDCFVGRVEQLESLHSRICRGSTLQSQTIVVHGHSGVGKTELIRKYIQDHSKRYEENIIWIDGKSSNTIVNTFKRLATEKLKINVKPNWNIKRLVKQVYMWFAKKKSLFIFDCVPDRKTMENFLPVINFEGNKPFVIITSYNSDWNGFEMFELNRFNLEESQELIALLMAKKAIREEVEKILFNEN